MEVHGSLVSRYEEELKNGMETRELIIMKSKENMMRQIVKIIGINNENSFFSSLSHCSFSVKSATIEEGVCTSFGACRFQGHDYMYQGGCGLFSNWGKDHLVKHPACQMMVTRKSIIEGRCTKSGHCWNKDHIKLFNEHCTGKV